MLKGLSLQQLAAKIEANAELKRDYIVPTEQTEMFVQADPAEGKKPARNTVLFQIPDHGSFPLLPFAHDQIGGRAGIPAKYYDKCLHEAPDLLCANVNAWHRINPAKRMVRTLGGDMRAFLSNQYNRIENEEIAKVAFPVLAELPGVQIVSSEVTDKRLYIHFVVPTIEGKVKKGDIVQAGGIIQNSEVGAGAVSVSGLLWRLICLNGMKTTDTFRKNHVGRKVEDSEELWADDTRQADDRAILLKVRDMVRAVVDETRFKVQLAKMQNLTEGVITGDPVRVVEVLAQRVGTSEAEQSGILRSLIEGKDLSAWGLLNSVTSLAHSAKSYDRAVELEAAGGQLLDLSNTEWKRMLEAA